MRVVLVVLVALALISGCNQQTSSSENQKNTQFKTDVSASSADPADSASVPALEVDGERAMQYVRDEVAFGPRPVGGTAHKRLEDFIRTHLKADTKDVEEDAFVADTPLGKFPMRNFIAKFPGTKDGVIVIASHYDTLISVKNFVGANDGGSSGLLLEMADKLKSAKPRDGHGIWIVFLDGEEALKQWSETDSDYGSRHLAAKWQQDGTLKKIKAFLLADMIGDADLDVLRDQNSTPWLEGVVQQAAVKLGYQSYFFQETSAVDDDHRPFVRAGVPCADLIDFTYGYNNVLWHTPQDTLDKLSPKSLKIVGDVMFETAVMLDQRR